MGAAALSNNGKNRINVDIYGQSYSIVGSESTSHIRLVASMVDDKMREISSINPSLDTSKLAVLTAVNAVHDFLKLKEEIEELEFELKKLRD
ncbi:cell division protein ZapA [Jeotgalibacillus aurantiacus]|uniref:cell division protein ZapA n=1 Tax=Jeotgalibacillus aurantiacus TaxID=2763266 RepID=UPI001D0ADA85|nr:cell division protein ZapA [Jeotgalibacillus aurantiacus]